MEQGEVLILGAVHLLLTGLPGAAAALFAARRGVRQVPVLLAIALAAAAAAGLLGFWAFYARPVLGESYAYFVILGSLLLGGYSLWGGAIEGRLLRQLAVPAALWALGTAFLLMFGYAHGGAETLPLPATAARFTHPLPGDNTISIFYSDWFFDQGHNGTPPVVATWHFSDRPPLQTGFALLQRTWGWDEQGLNYEVMAVGLQQLWIVGLWALLLAARVGRVARALAMLAVLVCGLTIVNGFYVWPKLLPAALLLGAAALLITPLWKELRQNVWAAALVAALFALALLGHGSSIFGVIALAAVAAWRGLPSWRWLAVAVAAGALLMVPWLAYQNYVDPPGNRLTKWTLGGVIEPEDERGTLETIVDSYSEAGIGGTIDYKYENFETMVGYTQTRLSLQAAFDEGGFEAVVRAVRAVSFFYLLPSLWLALLVPFAVAAGWRRLDRDSPEWRFALSCLAVFLVGVAGWGLISFGNLAARTVIHVGTFLLPLLAICGAAVALRAVFPRLAIAYVGLSVALGLLVYAPAFEPLPETSYQPLAFVLAGLALAGFAAVALRSADADGEPAASSS